MESFLNNPIGSHIELKLDWLRKPIEDKLVDPIRFDDIDLIQLNNILLYWSDCDNRIYDTAVYIFLDRNKY